MNKTTFISGLFVSAAVGILSGTIGAIIASKPVLANTLLFPSHPSEPRIITPSTPILLFQEGGAHASVKVDRNGLILLNLTTKTGQNQIALGVLGDSKLEVGVFDSAGKARAGMEVPMKTSGQVHMLLLDKHDALPSAATPAHS